MDLFKCETRHKFHLSICVFNLPIFEAIIFVTFPCHFEYCINWHAKILPTKSIAKIGTLNAQKKVRAKIGTLNVLKKVRVSSSNISV